MNILTRISVNRLHYRTFLQLFDSRQRTVPCLVPLLLVFIATFRQSSLKPSPVLLFFLLLSILFTTYNTTPITDNTNQAQLSKSPFPDRILIHDHRKIGISNKKKQMTPKQFIPLYSPFSLHNLPNSFNKKRQGTVLCLIIACFYRNFSLGFTQTVPRPAFNPAYRLLSRPFINYKSKKKNQTQHMDNELPCPLKYS